MTAPFPREPDAREALADHQIKYMVDRFLSWKLPENFNPDGGVSFERFGNKDTPHQYRRDPSGTNLIDATQAEVMVRHMIEGMPSFALRQPAAPEGEPVAWRYKCADGSEVLMFERLTAEQKRGGYYTGEDGEDEVDGDEAIVGPFYWAEETPLYASAPPSDERSVEGQALATAWEKYVALFGEQPHGTLHQMNALAALLPPSDIGAREPEVIFDEDDIPPSDDRAKVIEEARPARELWMAIDASIKEQIAEGDGFWRSCSGCHETVDGQNVHGHPYSDAFKCTLGIGCSECGGIGAIWDAARRLRRPSATRVEG